ncbi:hypothetical protein FRC01_002099 [Tulasnella sp. 417]|nr:hypothetical protein FRC01_002099 [Tulasnella sp. 417]
MTRDLAAEYNTRFGFLAGIGIFGAAAAFGPIFQPNHEDFADVLAWSTTCFILGTVLAGAGGAVAGVVPTGTVQTNVPHSSLRKFASVSAALVFVGICLLGGSLIALDAPGAIFAAGIVIVACSFIVVAIALYIVGCLKAWCKGQLSANAAFAMWFSPKPRSDEMSQSHGKAYHDEITQQPIQPAPNSHNVRNDTGIIEGMHFPIIFVIE